MAGKAGHNPNKRFLSKSILQMKFMSRSPHVTDEMSTANSNRDTQWMVDLGDVPERNIIIEESYMKLENLCQIGRISSKQFNPYIEKLLAEKTRVKEEDKSDEEVEEMEGISAAEMSSRYDSLVSNSARKRAPGLGEDDSSEDERQETSDRRKFLKPT